MMKKMVVLAVVALGLMVSGGAALHALDQQPMQAISPADVAKALELKERDTALAAREAEVAKREQTQAQVQKEIDEKLTRLAAMQAQMKNQITAMQAQMKDQLAAMQAEQKDQLAAIKTIETEAFTNLIKIYNSMKASKAAPLLDVMDEPSVVKILRAMKTDLAAQVISKMKPEKAASVSEELGLLNRR